MAEDYEVGAGGLEELDCPVNSLRREDVLPDGAAGAPVEDGDLLTLDVYVEALPQPSEPSQLSLIEEAPVDIDGRSGVKVEVGGGALPCYNTQVMVPRDGPGTNSLESLHAFAWIGPVAHGVPSADGGVEVPGVLQDPL